MAGSIPLSSERRGQELIPAPTCRGPERAQVHPAGTRLRAAPGEEPAAQGRAHQRSRALKNTLPR